VLSEPAIGPAPDSRPSAPVTRHSALGTRDSHADARHRAGGRRATKNTAGPRLGTSGVRLVVPPHFAAPLRDAALPVRRRGPGGRDAIQRPCHGSPPSPPTRLKRGASAVGGAAPRSSSLAFPVPLRSDRGSLSRSGQVLGPHRRRCDLQLGTNVAAPRAVVNGAFQTRPDVTGNEFAVWPAVATRRRADGCGRRARAGSERDAPRDLPGAFTLGERRIEIPGERANLVNTLDKSLRVPPGTRVAGPTSGWGRP